MNAKIKESRLAIVEKIMMHLANSVKPWESFIASGAHSNGVTGKAYRGANAVRLMLTAWEMGYESNKWYTFKQARELGAHVRKGEHACALEYWKAFKVTGDEAVEEGEEEDVKKYFKPVNLFYVFNAEQLDGLPEGGTTPKATETDFVQLLKNSSRCEVKELGADIPFYSPNNDYIHMPNFEQFTVTGAYETTLLHEMVHSTMHPDACGREVSFDADGYAREELVAELGSVLCAAEIGLNATLGASLQAKHEKNSASYLSAWLLRLSDDDKVSALFGAFGQAQRAADYIGARVEQTINLQSVTNSQVA